MNADPKIIPSKDILINAVPLPSSRIEKILEFALTFDPKEVEGIYLNAVDLKFANEESSLPQLRAHLYFEQRRWNHIGRRPDQKTEIQLREVIKLIREKLQ